MILIILGLRIHLKQLQAREINLSQANARTNAKVDASLVTNLIKLSLVRQRIKLERVMPLTFLNCS